MIPIFYGAVNEVRTRDLNLGKVALYQLSYVRIFEFWSENQNSVRDTGIEPVTSSVSGKRATAAPIAPKDSEESRQKTK